MSTKLERADVIDWMEKFKTGWTEKKKEDVLKLFEKTERYYERPFNPATTIEEIKVYWNDIDSVSEMTLDYEIVAVDSYTACIHWRYRYCSQGVYDLLDGIYTIKFNENKECIEFRQWWFKE